MELIVYLPNLCEYNVARDGLSQGIAGRHGSVLLRRLDEGRDNGTGRQWDKEMGSNGSTGLEFSNHLIWGFVGKDMRNRSEVVIIGHDGRAANGMSGNSVGKVCRIS